MTEFKTMGLDVFLIVQDQCLDILALEEDFQHLMFALKFAVITLLQLVNNVKIMTGDPSQETDALQPANSKLDGSAHFTLTPLLLLSHSLFVKETVWMDSSKQMKFVMTEFQLTTSDVNQTVRETFLGIYVLPVLQLPQVYVPVSAETTLLLQVKLVKIMTEDLLEEMDVMLIVSLSQDTLVSQPVT